MHDDTGEAHILAGGEKHVLAYLETHTFDFKQ